MSRLVAASLLACALAGCAASVVPAGDAAPARDGGACGSALACWSFAGTVALPSPKACEVDGDCVVRTFEADRTGTTEIVALSSAGVADFDRVARSCMNSGGAPPGPPFYEADGGVVQPGSNEAPVAVCRGGCCVAVPVEYDCDTRHATCASSVPMCPPGQTASVVNHCYGPCVPFTACTPMACSGPNPALGCPPDFSCAVPGICIPATD